MIANSFQGKRLNRPNDVVVKSDGSIYFTDPNGALLPEQWDLSFPGVYRVSPDLGTITLLTDNFVGPHGLAGGPPGKLANRSSIASCRVRPYAPPFGPALLVTQDP